MVSVIRKHSDRGLALARADVADAVTLIAEQMPLERKRVLRFKDGRSGRKCLAGFHNRSKEEMRFGAVSKQIAEPMAAKNAESLTSHMAAIEKVVEEHNFYAKRMRNLDETGATPGKDVIGKPRAKVFTRKQARRKVRL